MEPKQKFSKERADPDSPRFIENPGSCGLFQPPFEKQDNITDFSPSRSFQFGADPLRPQMNF